MTANLNNRFYQTLNKLNNFQISRPTSSINFKNENLLTKVNLKSR